MTTITDEERAQGIKELDEAGIVPDEQDLEYFRKKLVTMASHNASDEATLKVRNQLKLMEETTKSYKAQ